MIVAPAVYRFPNIQPFKFGKWGWNKLSEVAEILGIEKEQVMSYYIALSVDATTLVAIFEGDKSVYWFGMSSRIPTYVPTGWTSAVLRAHSEGISRVTRVSHEHYATFTVCPEGTIPWAPCVLHYKTFMYARVGWNILDQPYWTYAKCEHNHGTRRLGDLVNDKAVLRDYCIRCGAVVGGGK